MTPTDRLLDHIMQATAQAKQWTLAEGVFRAMTEKYGHGSLVTYQSMGYFVEVRQASWEYVEPRLRFVCAVDNKSRA